MNNQRKLFWGSFLVAILFVIAVAVFLNFKESSKINKLKEMFPDWIGVEGKITNFTALFPKEPKYATQDIPSDDSQEIVKQELFALEVDENTAYFIASTKYPVPIPGDTEENLRQSLQGMLQTVPEGKIITSKFVKQLSGKKFLEFEIHGPTTDIYFKGRLYISGDTLYQINMVYKKELYNDDVFSYFVNSLLVK